MIPYVPQLTSHRRVPSWCRWREPLQDRKYLRTCCSELLNLFPAQPKDTRRPYLGTLKLLPHDLVTCSMVDDEAANAP